MNARTVRKALLLVLAFVLILQTLSFINLENERAYASNAVSIGFEASEGYALGDVNGQPGSSSGTKWTSNAPAGTSMFEVVEGIDPGGGRAILAPEENPGLTANRNLEFKPAAAELGAHTLQGIKVNYSFDLMVDFEPVGNFTNLWVFGLGAGPALTDMPARLMIRGNGKLSYSDGGSTTLSKNADGTDVVLQKGQWITVNGILDYATQTYTLSVNGIQQMDVEGHSKISFRPNSPDVFYGFRLTNLLPGSDEQYRPIAVDNLQLNLVVEPVETEASWHNVKLRSAWERDRQLMGGDGSQVPRFMTFSPKNNYQTIFMGVDTAGLYRSDDGGASWTSKMEGINSFYVKTIAVDPGNPNVVYALVGGNPNFNSQAYGLYQSLDNGENWTQLNHFQIQRPPDNARALAIFEDSYDIAANRSLEIVVGANDGLHKSMDGGLTFNKVGEHVITDFVTSVLIDPDNANNVYVGTNNGLFRSVDRGETFEVYQSGLPENVSVAAMAIESDGHTLYAIVNLRHVYRKQGAANWELMGTGLPQTSALANGTYYDIQTHPTASGKVMLGLARIGSQGNFYYSSNFGDSWTRIYHSMDSNRFQGSPANPNNAFVADPKDADTWFKSFNLGTIYKTVDAGQTWQWSSENYGGARFRTFITNPHDPNHMVINTIDLGTLTTTDGGQSFERSKVISHGKPDGLGGLMISEPGMRDQAIVYAGIGMHSPVHEGFLEISTDGGRNFVDVPGTGGKQKASVSMHPVDSDYIYAGDVISKDGGSSWSNISDYYHYTMPGSFNQALAYEDLTQSYDFGTLPFRVSSNLNLGSINGTSITYRLADDEGNEILVWFERINTATTAIKYRIIDGQYDSGELTHAEVSSAGNIRLDVTSAYIRIKSAGPARMVWHDFENTSDYKLSVSVEHPSETVNATVSGLNVESAIVQIINADPLDPETLYLFDGLNLYRSQDAGATRELINTIPHLDPDNLYRNFIASAVMSPDGQSIYFGFVDGVFIYNIADDTFSFKTFADGFVPNIDGSLHISQILIDPTDSDTIYAGELNLTGGNGAGVFVSRDAGGTWAPMDQTGFFGTKRIWGLGVDGYGQLWAFTDQGPFWYGDLQLPGTPEQVTAAQSTDGVLLNWSASEDAYTYQVKRGTSAAGPFEVIQGGVNGTSYLDESALPETTYYYTVSAGNLVGEGAASSVVASTTNSEEPTDPLIPFTVEAEQALTRTNGLSATVRVEQTEGASQHEGSEVIVFQLMKGDMPVSYVALTKDFTQDEVVTGHFDVSDPENEQYAVHVFVLDTLISSETEMPNPLSDKVIIN